MVVDQLIKQYPRISDQIDARELRVILNELEHRLQKGAVGSVVEFGCYVGTTSLFIRRLLNHYHFQGEFHVYDSFAGLPQKTVEDQSVAGDQFVAGELFASRKSFIENFKKAGLRIPYIHRGWFNELQEGDVPDTIFFAFFDGDYYDSIASSFRLCTPKLAARATIIVDDYTSSALPGAARATDEWARRYHWSLRPEASLGIIHTTHE